jgi:hypothetical protein
LKVILHGAQEASVKAWLLLDLLVLAINVLQKLGRRLVIVEVASLGLCFRIYEMDQLVGVVEYAPSGRICPLLSILKHIEDIAFDYFLAVL